MEKVKEKILQRRKQMFVHSAMYYFFGHSIVTDETFDRWAMDLVELQNKYPEVSKATKYYKHFKDWDGHTGFHLTIPNKYFLIARKLIWYKENGGK